MPRTPHVSQPRHRAPIVVKSRELPEIAAADQMLGEVGRGEYGGRDAAGKFLAMCRDEVLGGRAAWPTRQRDPWHELCAGLAAASLMATLGGIAVILGASVAAGLVVLAMAASWAVIAGIVMWIARVPR